MLDVQLYAGDYMNKSKDPFVFFLCILWLIICILAMCLESCSTIRDVEHVVEIHDTISSVQIRIDSVYVEAVRIDSFIQHDSIVKTIVQNERGDVIRTDRDAYYWREAWHNEVNNKIEAETRADSLKSLLNKIDTSTTFVEKQPPSIWAKFQSFTWWILLGLVAGETTLIMLIRYATKKSRQS